MPRNANKIKRRSARRMSPVHITEQTGRFIQSPGTSVIFAWNNLPTICQAAPFTIRSIRITCGAIDVASANKQSFGQATFQIRQISPNAQSKTSSGDTIKTSEVFMVGNEPKRFFFKFKGVEYPEKFRGDACIAIDCICPRQNPGWEIGLNLQWKILYQVRHQSQSEACGELTVIPYSIQASYLQLSSLDTMSVNSEPFEAV